MEEEMKNRGNYEFEYLFLKDTHLEDCKGCFNCVSRGIELCPLKDDLELIQEKMMEADGLIMVSPVYVMTVSALLKNFIDRLAYLCHRPEYHGKKAVVLCTSGGSGVKETLDYMKMVTNAWGYKVTGKCGLATAPWPPKDGMKKKNSRSLQKSSHNFDKSLQTTKKEKYTTKRVGLKDYMSFRIFKTISENVKEYIPADYQFYKNKEYYQPVQIGNFTKILTGIMLQLVFFLMRDMGPGEEGNR
jgi:multimeric flavodoxin WrbA